MVDDLLAIVWIHKVSLENLVIAKEDQLRWVLDREMELNANILEVVDFSEFYEPLHLKFVPLILLEDDDSENVELAQDQLGSESDADPLIIMRRHHVENFKSLVNAWDLVCLSLLEIRLVVDLYGLKLADGVVVQGIQVATVGLLMVLVREVDHEVMDVLSLVN